MRINLSLIVFLLAVYVMSLYIPASGQTKSATEVLSGRVVYRENLKAVRGAQIWVFAARGTGHYSVKQDKNGEFSITLPEGYYYLFVANLGFLPYAKEIWLEHKKPVKLTVSLEPDFEIMQDLRSVSH